MIYFIYPLIPIFLQSVNKNFDFYVQEDENAEGSFEEIRWAAEQEKEQLSSFTFECSIKGDYNNAQILVDGLQVM